MTDHLSIFLLAAGPGAMIGLMSLGLITIHRSSGVLYLAQPAVATVGGYLYVEFSQPGRLAPAVAVAVASALTGLLSVGAYLIVMRPLRKTSAVTKLVASIGVALILTSLMFWRFGEYVYEGRSVLPVGPASLPFDLFVGKDRLLLLGIAVVLTAVLWAGYRFTRFGVRTSAIAESPFFARVYGLRSERLAVVNWLIAGVLDGFAGAMLASVNGISLTLLADLIVAILAAGVIGSMRSFPLAMLGAVAIAYLQAEGLNVSGSLGVSAAIPFAILFVVMMTRGQDWMSRDFTQARLPAIGFGKVRWKTTAVIAAVVLLSINTWLPEQLQRPLLSYMVYGILLLSIVVVAGYAGQLSLATMVLAGFGAFCATHVAADWGWPFPLAVLAAITTAALLATVQTIAATRLRSVNFAVMTLALGVFVYATALLTTEGIAVPSPTLFGLDVSIISNPRVYVSLCSVVFILCVIAVTNLRRGRSGLRMIAVRGNERVASSLGIDVLRTKGIAFAVSGGLAGLGGVLLSYQTTSQSFESFTPWQSADLVSWATIGGIASAAGPAFGSMLSPGSLGTALRTAIYDNTAVLGVVGGCLLILTLRRHPDGAAFLVQQIKDRRARRRRELAAAAARSDPSAAEATDGGSMDEVGVDELGVAEDVVALDDRVAAMSLPDAPALSHVAVRGGRTLRVSHLSVNFGGVKALVDVSFAVEPGTVHGLMGSNGSGKTTLLDVVSGFTKPSEGEVWLGDQNVSGLTAWRRARSGVGRSFQNGQLLADFNVGENILLTGIASGGWVAQDLVAPRKPQMSETAVAVIRRLDLEEILTAHIDQLTHGKRQLVSIARAVATAPGFVLLDEPAAGLDLTERQELRSLVRELAVELNIGILLVEHDVSLVLDVCDVVTVLHNGRVIAEGPPSVIRTSPEVQAAYLGESLAEPEPGAESDTGLASVPSSSVR